MGLTAIAAMRALSLLVFLFQMALQTTAPPVYGRVMNGAKPVTSATVIYTNEATEKAYKTKTDDKGEFAFVAVLTGAYTVEVFRRGERIFHGRQFVFSEEGFHAHENFLAIDLAKSNSEDAHAMEVNRLVDESHASLAAKDWPAAQKQLEELIALEPNHWEYYQNLGAIEIYTRQYAAAVKTFDKAMAVANSTLSVTSPELGKEKVGWMLMSQGEAYNALADYDNALRVYQQAADHLFHPAMALFLACQAKQHTRDSRGAADLCRRAIAADPTQWDFYSMLGRIQAESDPQGAIATYEQGVAAAKQQLADDPDNSVIKAGIGQMRNAQGNLYASRKEYEQAVKSFQEATGLSANPALPWSNLCITYFNLQRWDEAVAACDKTIGFDAYYEDAYYIKASALLATVPKGTGKLAAPPGAREALEKYLQLAPNGTYSASARSKLQQIGAP